MVAFFRCNVATRCKSAEQIIILLDVRKEYESLVEHQFCSTTATETIRKTASNTSHTTFIDIILFNVSNPFQTFIFQFSQGTPNDIKVVSALEQN